MKHGRATLPFGKYKGVRIRLLPDDYLSWLTTAPMMQAPQWHWLWESLIAELKFRGFKYELAETQEPILPVTEMFNTRRKIREDL